MKKWFDTNGYSKDENRPLPIGKNKKVIGLMKDELGGKIMTEFVALRAKMYAYRKIDKKVEEKRCKGIKKCVVAEGLFDGETIYRKQMLFEIKKHKVYTVNKHKIALNRVDDRRLVQADGITKIGQGTCSAFGLITIKDVFLNFERLLKIFAQGVHILCSKRENLCSCF